MVVRLGQSPRVQQLRDKRIMTNYYFGRLAKHAKKYAIDYLILTIATAGVVFGTNLSLSAGEGYAEATMRALPVLGVSAFLVFRRHC